MVFEKGGGALAPDFLEFITRPLHSWTGRILLLICIIIIVMRLTGKLKMPWDKKRGGSGGSGNNPLGGQIYKL